MGMEDYLDRRGGAPLSDLAGGIRGDSAFLSSKSVTLKTREDYNLGDWEVWWQHPKQGDYREIGIAHGRPYADTLRKAYKGAGRYKVIPIDPDTGERLYKLEDFITVGSPEEVGGGTAAPTAAAAMPGGQWSPQELLEQFQSALNSMAQRDEQRQREQQEQQRQREQQSSDRFDKMLSTVAAVAGPALGLMMQRMMNPPAPPVVQAPAAPMRDPMFDQLMQAAIAKLLAPPPPPPPPPPHPRRNPRCCSSCRSWPRSRRWHAI